MHSIVSNNYRDFLVEALQLLISEGQQVAPRGSSTIELEDTVFHIRDPRARCPSLPFRNANIFALIAETLWLLGGKNDIQFISHYLPRISQFSDDGVVLSGAYGPRIRSWHGVDQLRSVFRTLRNDLTSRRAVIGLFDPHRDHEQDRKDIPCNSLLQFTVRNNALNLRVTSRSMDVIWGSAINVFEWTVLQEILALWLGVELGSYTHFVGSLHIYDDFVPRANKILSAETRVESHAHLRIDMQCDDFDDDLATFFQIESDLRRGAKIEDLRMPKSTWLHYIVQMFAIYHEFARSKDLEIAIQKLSLLGASDFQAMAVEYLTRISEQEK